MFAAYVDEHVEARYEEIINHLHKALSSTEEDEQDFKVMSKALAAVFPSTAFFVWARRTRSTTGKQSSRQRGKNKKKREKKGKKGGCSDAENRTPDVRTEVLSFYSVC